MSHGWLCVLGCLVLVGCTAGAQTPTEGDSARAAQPPAGRASFLLPDIVVEGEDLRRLGGGARSLDLKLPWVAPQLAPVLVEPGPTAYVVRPGLDFELPRPALPAPAGPRGLWRAEVGDGPAAEASAAWLPRVDGAWMLWADLDGHSDRGPGVDRLAVRLGASGAQPTSLPRARIEVGAGTDHARWEQAAGVGPAGDQRWLGLRAIWERPTSGLGPAGLAWAAGRIGEVRARWDARPSPGAGRVVRSARWTAAELGWHNAPAPRDLRVARGPAALRVLADLRGTVAWAITPEDSSAARLRGRARLGLTRSLDLGRLSGGIAFEGDGDEALTAPWLLFSTCGARGLGLSVEVAPRATWADELMLGADALQAGEREPAAWHRLDRLTVGDGDPDRATRPGATRAGPALPLAAVVDPLAPPQIAWPRIMVEALARRGPAWVRLVAAAAELERPYGWRPDSLRFSATEAAIPVWRLTTNTDRRLVGAEVEAGWRPTAWLAARAAYGWTRDESPALAFSPEHVVRGELRGAIESWLWTTACVWRDDAAWSDGGSDLSAAIGWSFGRSRLWIRAENLLAEDLRPTPGDGSNATQWRVIWEQALDSALP